jgi:hypothetical protein
LKLPVVLAAVVALAGCGGDDSGAEARETGVAWLSALVESDGERACGLMAPELVAQAQPSCERVYGGYGEVLGETLGAAGLALEDILADEGAALVVSVDGEHAAVELPGGVFLPIELRRTDSGWRVVRGLRPA